MISGQKPERTSSDHRDSSARGVHPLASPWFLPKKCYNSHSVSHDTLLPLCWLIITSQPHKEKHAYKVKLTHWGSNWFSTQIYLCNIHLCCPPRESRVHELSNRRPVRIIWRVRKDVTHLKMQLGMGGDEPLLEEVEEFVVWIWDELQQRWGNNNRAEENWQLYVMIAQCVCCILAVTRRRTWLLTTGDILTSHHTI